MPRSGEPGPSAERRENGPRRSGLVQERSRRTRRDLVDAAMRLWTERGFETGIDDTTVEEIAREAGVTKGTFYFHFAHKEDILLEIGWFTSQATLRDATAALAGDAPVDAVLDTLLTGLARRISETPRAAVGRTLAEFYRNTARRDTEPGEERYGFQRSFALVFFHAQQSGHLPDATDARVLGEVMGTMTVGAISSWIAGVEPDLAAAFRLRAALLLAGIRGLGEASACLVDPASAFS
ncbi:MAG TPA: helix-turn-helix domain-containing protein [Acidimicrobiia bacterium]|nr:helix-turn-helix domain-containing protein [Acidimicrobiia bacterium]